MILISKVKVSFEFMWLAWVAQVSDILSMLQGPSLLFRDHSIIFITGDKRTVHLKKKVHLRVY